MRLNDLRKIVPKAVYDECRRQLRILNNKNTNSSPDLERGLSHELLAKSKNAAFNTPVCIRIHSIRKHLADADGISAKAAIDGLRYCGILSDDTTAQVAEIGYTQETARSGADEATVLTITTKYPATALTAIRRSGQTGTTDVDG